MSILKKSSTFTFVVALIMVMAMSVTAFGAEVPVDQESANAAATAESVTTNDNEADSTVTELTGAKFVKANGDDYGMGMGTDVIQRAEINGSTITLTLQPKWVGIFRGEIIKAYYEGSSNNLVTKVGGTRYMTLETTGRVVEFANGMYGIHLATLHFKFIPFKPPGMPNPVQDAYFVCNQFTGVQ